MTRPRVTAIFPRVTPYPALDRILGNLWWTWDVEARRLIKGIDRAAWRASRGVVPDYIERISTERWEALRSNGFPSQLAQVEERFDAYLKAPDTWWTDHHRGALPGGIAYFSAEFGLHEGLPIYSGGLGVLAGDHLKSASDLGIPLVAVGLCYHEGYFRQRVDDEGRQHEHYDRRRPRRLGLSRARGAGGQPLEVYIPLFDRTVRCEVWLARVGRVPLYLLDTDVIGNTEDDRRLTRRLYGGDPHIRICQEIVLGIGGLRALRAAGYRMDVMHLNEGHTAFAVLERVREEQSLGADRASAWKTVESGTVFTTHTPVPAGHDRFWYELVDSVLGRYGQQLGMYTGEMMDLGRVHSGSDEQLCMTVLALTGSRSANGVSEKHGEVSRKMWEGLSTDLGAPIGHITNGVHAPSWVGSSIQDLLDRCLGDEWRARLATGERLDAVEDIAPRALWEAHLAQKRRLVDFVALRTGKRVSSEALIIGFARRFAAYKRGDLVLSQPERLGELLKDPNRPVVLLYAGKAHPRDEIGKGIIKRVIEASKRPDLERRIVFIEDYDIAVGRALTQGVDVWLNNPRRPLEASGTSGQKVAMNGGLNCSTLDGWWLEGYAAEPLAGWGVGSIEPTDDVAQGDHDDAEALYSILENEVVPCFWDRAGDGLPDAWVRRMAAAIATCLPAFNTDRMLADYVAKAYKPDLRPSTESRINKP